MRSGHNSHTHVHIVVGWVAMAASLTGVAIQSLFPQFMRYSFVVFFLAAFLWFVDGLLTGNRPLTSMQMILMVLNAVAIVRWFG